MLATMSDAVREYAFNYGAPANVAWILSPYDSWEPNPRYAGPYLGHPENDERLGECFLTFKEASQFARSYAMSSRQVVKVIRHNTVFVVYY
jgi:hypothetical protein